MPPGKNFGRVLAKLDFKLPGFPNIPRAPDAFEHRDYVDVYIAKRRLELVGRLPVIDVNAIAYLKSNQEDFDVFGSTGSLNQRYLSNLIASGHLAVVDELTELKRKEKSAFLNNSPRNSVRPPSFTNDNALCDELVQGLIQCAEAEVLDDVFKKVRCRRSLAEKMIVLKNYWLARKMLIKALSFLEYYHDEELDKCRVELWCFISYICIYHEESQKIGFDLPTSCLALARQVSKGKPWKMQRSIMRIVVADTMNIYGLRNDWTQIKSDLVNMYIVATTLDYVLSVKKARFWQEELHHMERHGVNHEERKEGQVLRLKENIEDALTTALACADEINLYSSFIATSLRRGLFFEEQGEWEGAMEDFNAMHLLSLKYGQAEATAMALNRIGHSLKRLQKPVTTLDYFVHEWELSCKNSFEELQADALKDMAVVLLEEGQAWEAEECMSQAYNLFRKTRKEDTPNNLDDITWAMSGVIGGHNLWGRYSTLIRTQENSNIDAIREWKSLRKNFPIAAMPQNWYKVQPSSDYTNQYGELKRKQKHGLMSQKPSPIEKEHSTSVRHRSPSSHKGKVFFNVEEEEEEEEDKSRRFFEFTKSEVRSSVWLQKAGFENIFDFINASDKPRDTPRFVDSLEEEGRLPNELMFLDDLDYNDSFNKRRRSEAIRWDTSYRKSIAKLRKSTLPTGLDDMVELVDTGARRKSVTKKNQAVDRWGKMMDPKLEMGKRLSYLLEDMDDIIHLKEDKQKGSLATVVKFSFSVDDKKDETDEENLRISDALKQAFGKSDDKQAEP